jgi:hypothetical protein
MYKVRDDRDLSKLTYYKRAPPRLRDNQLLFAMQQEVQLLDPALALAT